MHTAQCSPPLSPPPAQEQLHRSATHGAASGPTQKSINITMAKIFKHVRCTMELSHAILRTKHTCYPMEANTNECNSLPSRCTDGLQNRALWSHAILSASESQQGFPGGKKERQEQMFKCPTHWTTNDEPGFECLTHSFIVLLHQELKLLW